ncbi:MAG: CatB-related O-acetyltransferase [Atopobiaceae bacterium]|nr:CatB-related O-acetyltransferase [Atopobiaceae bacterium]
MEGTEIGRYTCIGPNVTTAIGRHPTSGFISQHPAFYSITSPIGFTYVESQKFEEVKYAQKYINSKDYSIVIENDVWIGANVTILDGVTIGNGAVIAAGSIVTKDVDAYSIVGGVPAKHLKYRFESEDIRRKLQEFEWWNLNEVDLKEIAETFDDICKFQNSILSNGIKEEEE